jgi:hypothetical protein
MHLVIKIKHRNDVLAAIACGKPHCHLEWGVRRAGNLSSAKIDAAVASVCLDAAGTTKIANGSLKKYEIADE